MRPVRAVDRIPLYVLVCLGGALCAPHAMLAAAPAYKEARVTLIENDAYIGVSGESDRRKAAVDSVLRSNNYLQTEANARAELEFDDRSIVRVGQSTVFSFDSETRTLSLERGAMLFYVPKGNGGQIKTPTLTAAITGTLGKVSENLIAVLSGELTTKWGKVPAGWAIEWVNGKVRIFKFDPDEATKGRLYTFGGPLPEQWDAGDVGDGTVGGIPKPDLRHFDIEEWMNTNSRVNDVIRDNAKDEPTPEVKNEEGEDHPIFTPRPRHTPRPSPTSSPSFFPSGQ
jgi:hypothetical protein